MAGFDGSEHAGRGTIGTGRTAGSSSVAGDDDSEETTVATVARITELSARSEDSFEDAIETGVERATSTLRNVRGAWVKEQEVVIENGEITAYEVIMKITFELEE